MQVRKKPLIVCTICSILLFSFFSNVLAQPVRTPSTETIPAIINTSPGVIYQCTSPFVFPGSISTGSSGFIRVSCPSPANGRLQLGTNTPITLTPTLTLSTGYTQVAIVYYTNPCSFKFPHFLIGNVSIPSGAFLNQSLTFASPPVAGQLLATNYDYCLQYANAPTLGLGSFTIVWT